MEGEPNFPPGLAPLPKTQEAHAKFALDRAIDLDSVCLSKDRGIDTPSVSEPTIRSLPETLQSCMRIGFHTSFSNTSAVTLNVNSVGPKAIVRNHDVALAYEFACVHYPTKTLAENGAFNKGRVPRTLTMRRMLER